MCAGEGDDSVGGQSGANRVFGEDGKDVLHGEGVNYGGPDDDTLRVSGIGGRAEGGEGNDILRDDIRRQVLVGGPGDAWAPSTAISRRRAPRRRPGVVADGARATIRSRSTPGPPGGPGTTP